MKIENKQQYGAIDIMKFLCSLLIVSAHYVTENAEGRINKILEYSVSLYIIVVPFFFCCSGFLIFKKIFSDPESGGKRVLSYCKHLMIMYGVWSVIYLSFKIAEWMKSGASSNSIIKYLINSIFYSTYKTIWFLPALCVGTIIAYFLIKHIGLKKTLAVAGIFYLIGALGVSYKKKKKKSEILSDLPSKYDYVFVSTRNGVFNAFPFIVMGAFIAQRRDSHRGKIAEDLIPCIVSGAMFVAEAFLLKFKFSAPNANTLIMLLPFTYFFVSLCLDIKISSGKWLLWMRKMSTAVFLCQRIFLSAIPAVWPDGVIASVLNGNPYLGIVIILFMVVALSSLLVFISQKNRFFSVLC